MLGSSKAVRFAIAIAIGFILGSVPLSIYVYVLRNSVYELEQKLNIMSKNVERLRNMIRDMVGGNASLPDEFLQKADPGLVFEIARAVRENQSAKLLSVVIEFSQELSESEIRFYEESRFQFDRAEGMVVHTGKLYSGLCSIDVIFELAKNPNVVRLEYGFKRIVPP